MIPIQNYTLVDYIADSYQGTGDTCAMIIIGSGNTWAAVNAYLQLRKLGVSVTLIAGTPDPEEKPFLFPIRCMGTPTWQELHGGAPHRVPNHYPPAPPKIQFKSTAFIKPKITIKQPLARAGSKRILHI